ncbi:hypothetical protein [Paenibacillus polysaccharolyticus]|uniref:hypothetical protein n=1 Tax=Paenibacillus polysaccharolyticus TaxID=582692 RepID=UPI003009F4E2
MAKLNVVIPAVEVTVDGVTYRKVDRKAQAGDIIRFDGETDVEEITSGGFYAVNRIDSFGDARITDDFGDDDYDTAGEDFDVYAPTSEPSSNTITFQGATWRKVDRDVREGDAIKFTDEDRSHYLTESELYVVNEVDYNDDPQITDDDEDEYDAGGDDYEVYEKVADSAAVEYREVKRKAAVGERIRITNRVPSEDRYKNGDEFVVNSADSDGDVRVSAAGSDRTFVMRIEYVVLEPVTAKPAESTQPERLKVGEYARVVDATHMYADSGVAEGSIVKITQDDESYRPFKTELTNGNNAGWFTATELVRATDEEVAAAKRAALIAQFSVGDHVRMTVEDGKRPSFGYGGVSNGDIGKVTRKYKGHIIVDFPANNAWLADASELTKLTAEEAAEIERKQAEEKRWAAIGRKVNEFKVGDIVEAKRRLRNSEVILGEVCDVQDEPSTYLAITSYVDGNYRSVDVIKLIVPVEQRFDTKEVDAA